MSQRIETGKRQVEVVELLKRFDDSLFKTVKIGERFVLTKREKDYRIRHGISVAFICKLIEEGDQIVISYSVLPGFSTWVSCVVNTAAFVLSIVWSINNQSLVSIGFSIGIVVLSCALTVIYEVYRRKFIKEFKDLFR